MIVDKVKLKAAACRVMTDRRFCGDDVHKELSAGVMVLLAENAVLRAMKLPAFLPLSDEMRADGDHAVSRAREDQCSSAPVLTAVFFEAAAQRWLNDQEEIIDAAVSTPDTRPSGCCCPPPGHTGIWAAAMCPVHQGLRRTVL